VEISTFVFRIGRISEADPCTTYICQHIAPIFRRDNATKYDFVELSGDLHCLASMFVLSRQYSRNLRRYSRVNCADVRPMRMIAPEVRRLECERIF